VSLTIETELKEVLEGLNRRFDKLDQKLDNVQKDLTDLKIGQVKIEGEIRTLDERLTGKIDTLDERLTGKIDTLDERLTGKIDALDTKVDGINTRLGLVEFSNRGIFIGLIMIVLGGAAKMFGFLAN
jgi:chromosome segregation ATPase